MAVRPIFIIGTGRSGTTLLRALLNAHPDLHISKESSLYFELREKHLQRHPEKELSRFFSSAPFRWLGLDANVVRKDLPDRPTRKAVFKALMRSDAARHNKQYWGDKTPGHWLYLSALKSDFPEALIIHLIRDPRQVIPSLLRMPWASPSWLANALYCEKTYQTLLNDSEVLQIRFEDLINNPKAIVEDILLQAGLTWDEQILQHHIYSPNDVQGIPWLDTAYQALKPAMARPQKTSRLDPWIEFFCASAFQSHYQRQAHKRAFSTLIRDLPVLVKSIFSMARILYFPLQRGEPELRAWLSQNKGAFAHWPDWDIDKAVAVQLNQAYQGDNPN